MGGLIKIDLGLGLAGLMTMVLVLVYQQWLFYTRGGGPTKRAPEGHIYQCPFCTHLFNDFCSAEIVQCPRCHSLLGVEEKTGQAPGEKGGRDDTATG